MAWDLDHEKDCVYHGRPEYLGFTETNEQGHPTPAGIAQGERFVARARNWTPFAWWLYGLWRGAREAWPVLVCAAVDHAWVDDSYGGPDSGCMAGHCSRCGFGFSHTLY